VKKKSDYNIGFYGKHCWGFVQNLRDEENMLVALAAGRFELYLLFFFPEEKYLYQLFF